MSDTTAGSRTVVCYPGCSAIRAHISVGGVHTIDGGGAGQQRQRRRRHTVSPAAGSPNPQLPTRPVWTGNEAAATCGQRRLGRPARVGGHRGTEAAAPAPPRRNSSTRSLGPDARTAHVFQSHAFEYVIEEGSYSGSGHSH